MTEAVLWQNPAIREIPPLPNLDMPETIWLRALDGIINKNIPWVPHGAQGYYYAHPRHTIKSRPSQNISPAGPGSAGGRAAVRTALSWKRKMLGWWRDWVYSNMIPSLL